MSFVAKEFGKRIAEARKSRGMTQADLAWELNISDRHMGAIEQGSKTCSLEILVALSECLGVTTDYLLMGKKENSSELIGRIEKAVIDLQSIAQNIKQ